MNPAAILRVVRICAALVLLAVIVVPSCRFGYNKGAAAGNARADKMQADYNDAALYAERTARATEQAHAAALDAVATQYEQDKTDAQATHDRVVADLRRGAVKLQNHWTCPDVSKVAASPGQPDDGADLRQSGAAALIAAADAADAQVRALQAVTQADRK